VLVGAVLLYYETQRNEGFFVSFFYKIYFVRSDRGRKLIDFILTCGVLFVFRVRKMGFDLIDIEATSDL
jgi:hypothetical protein